MTRIEIKKEHLPTAIVITPDGDQMGLVTFSYIADINGFIEEEDRCSTCESRIHDDLWYWYEMPEGEANVIECTSCILKSANTTDSPDRWFVETKV